MILRVEEHRHLAQLLLRSLHSEAMLNKFMRVGALKRGMGATVFWIPGPWRGRLGIVPRPRGAEWLDDEVRAWREAGINVVVSLLEPHEESEFGLAGESPSSAAGGLEFRSFPSPNRSVPKSRESVAQLASRMVEALNAGKNVVLHCRQSIGRSGMIAAAALISSGEDPGTALENIRRSRGVEVPETEAQRRWLSDFSSWLSHKEKVTWR